MEITGGRNFAAVTQKNKSNFNCLVKIVNFLTYWTDLKTCMFKLVHVNELYLTVVVKQSFSSHRMVEVCSITPCCVFNTSKYWTRSFSEKKEKNERIRQWPEIWRSGRLLTIAFIGSYRTFPTTDRKFPERIFNARHNKEPKHRRFWDEKSCRSWELFSLAGAYNRCFFLTVCIEMLKLFKALQSVPWCRSAFDRKSLLPGGLPVSETSALGLL